MSQSNRFSQKDLLSAIADLSLIDFFPRSDSAYCAALMLRLAKYVPSLEALKWLTETAADEFSKWPGWKGLRALLDSSKYGRGDEYGRAQAQYERKLIAWKAEALREIAAGAGVTIDVRPADPVPAAPPPKRRLPMLPPWPAGVRPVTPADVEDAALRYRLKKNSAAQSAPESQEMAF